MLDEPTAGMSNTETEYITDLILKVTAGKTLIMVEHDMGVVFGQQGIEFWSKISKSSKMKKIDA